MTRVGGARRGVIGGGWLLSLLLLTAASAIAQEQVQVRGTITVPKGHSTVVIHPSELERVMVTDPTIADAVPITFTEVVLNGTEIGSTTLLFWGTDGTRAAYTIRVTPNVGHIQDELQRLFPGAGIQATVAGNSILLTGSVNDARLATRAVQLVTTLGGGAEVMDYISIPDRAQILLQVRIAEVSRSALQQIGTTFMRVDPNNLRGGDEVAVGQGTLQGNFLGGGGPDVTLSDVVNFYLFHEASSVGAFIQALRNEGVFRSLAEPNLLAFPGDTASFLAGGEFPFPSVQGSSGSTSVEFKEFGIRLNFLPEITNSGAIHLRVAPEVSQLDFANGLQISGFVIPSLLSRRASTTIELQDGQTFAIAGLMDSQMSRNVSKIPLLGDIPILGALFRSQEMRDNQTELLVLVTPHLVYPQNTPPPLPTGEVDSWGVDRFMRPPPPPQ